MVLSTEWSQVEVIDLVNDGNGLGFMLVGGRSTGVVVKALMPGGIAERDGRLQSGDHVLQIGEVNLRGFCSEQVASVLRQAGQHVRLIVARPVEASGDYQSLASHAPIIPTKLLSDPEELTRHLYQNPAFPTSAEFLQHPELFTELQAQMASVGGGHQQQRASLQPLELVTTTCAALSADIPMISPIIPIISPDSTQSSVNADTPETEIYEVELKKNVYGLGITVAGYVCEEEDVSGIFVKSIVEGSAAEMSRRIQINDRIVAVDGNSLGGFTNHQAVEVLRNTEIIVHLTLERFLRGRKYEHLQVALTEAKAEVQSQSSLPPSPSIATLSWVAAKSDADSVVTEDGPNEFEIASHHTTFDSNMSMVLDNFVDNPPSSEEGRTPNDDRSGDESNSCDLTGEFNEIENDEQININENDNEIKPKQNHCRMNGKENHINPNEKDKNSKECLHSTPTPTPSLNSSEKSWQNECPQSDIIVTEINKLSGLGISLEGTVDVEFGVEKHPHHYIRSILKDSPVGIDGKLKPGDEILQVNEHKVLGLMHTDVVKILKELPPQVKLVCARGPKAPCIINTSQNPEAFESRSLLPGGHQCLQGLLIKAQSESSLYTSSTATLTDQLRSKSVEQVSGLALWSTDVIYINIEKTDRGFGFSILDYQDPLDPEGTVIVIRGLIPGGSAEGTNQIFPGDRLISVLDISLQGVSLDEAVSILKGIPIGLTRIGICRPLSTSENGSDNAISHADSNST